MHTSFVLLIVVPALASALQAPPCDTTYRVRLTVHGTNSFMTYPKGGGHIEVRTDTPSGSGSLFCRIYKDGSDGQKRGVIYKAVESDSGNKVLRHNGQENVPAGVYDYLKLNGERYLSPIGQPGYFYLEPQNAQGMVLKHDTDTDEVILVPRDDKDLKIRWNQFTA